MCCCCRCCFLSSSLSDRRNGSSLFLSLRLVTSFVFLVSSNRVLWEDEGDERFTLSAGEIAIGRWLIKDLPRHDRRRPGSRPHASVLVQVTRARSPASMIVRAVPTRVWCRYRRPISRKDTAGVTREDTSVLVSVDFIHRARLRFRFHERGSGIFPPM